MCGPDKTALMAGTPSNSGRQLFTRFDPPAPAIVVTRPYARTRLVNATRLAAGSDACAASETLARSVVSVSFDAHDPSAMIRTQARLRSRFRTVFICVMEVSSGQAVNSLFIFRRSLRCERHVHGR